MTIYRSKRMFFHLSQNIWRNVKELGLQVDYIQDTALALCILLLPALAFASPFDVAEIIPSGYRTT